MKIAFLVKTKVYSGAENVVITLMRLLSEKNDVYYVSPSGEIDAYLKKYKLKHIILKSISPKEIKEKIQIIKPDIIHTTDFSMSFIAAMIKGKIPVISQLHNNPTWIKKWYDPRTIAYAIALPRISHVITVSNAIEKDFFYSKLMHKKNTVIHNIIDIKDIQKKAVIAHKLVSKSDLVFLGRLTYQKNPILFCQIVKKLKTEYHLTNIKAIMLGKGEMEQEIKEYIQSNGLRNNIQLLGFQKNPYVYIKASKIGVMPSRFEGFGLAAAEYMALGKPVLCSGAGGLSEVVNNKCGKLCNNIEDYAKEVITLLTNHKEYEQKATNALKQAKSFDNKEEYVKKFEDIYEQVLLK